MYSPSTDSRPQQEAAPPFNSSSLDVSTGIPVNSGYHSAPPPAPLQIGPPGVPWSSGLYDCCSDVHSCCLTCWCPCITFGRISEIVDKGSTSCCGNGVAYWLMGFRLSYSYRSKMRQEYSLRNSPCNDVIVHCFCGPCALCQEYRELTHRGYDMSIGWQGNVEKRNREISKNPASAPPVQGSMTR